MIAVYESMYHTKPLVTVIHAGLECGLFYEKMDDLDCISIGPNMEKIHTSEERLELSSVKRVWDYLTEVLKMLKD